MAYVGRAPITFYDLYNAFLHSLHKECFLPRAKTHAAMLVISWISIVLFPMSTALSVSTSSTVKPQYSKWASATLRSNDCHFLNVNFSRILHANTRMQRLWPSSRHMPYSRKKKKYFSLGPSFVFWLKSAMSQLCFLVENFCKKGYV